MVPFEKRNHCLCCCGQDSPLCNYFFVFLAAYSNQIWIQNILLAWENLLIKMAFRPPTPLFLRASDQWLKVAYFCGDSGGILFSKSGSTVSFLVRHGSEESESRPSRPSRSTVRSCVHLIIGKPVGTSSGAETSRWDPRSGLPRREQQLLTPKIRYILL